MPTRPRNIFPGVPVHITQRGAQRQEIFSCEADYQFYKELLADACRHERLPVWAYAFMTNHVHLILFPETIESVARALGRVHSIYSARIQLRRGEKGRLLQGRFASFPMDDAHLYAGTRYVELNPVEAAMVDSPYDWKWSSARAHRDGQDDGLVIVKPLLERYGDWERFLAGSKTMDEADKRLRRRMGQLGLP